MQEERLEPARVLGVLATFGRLAETSNLHAEARR